MTFTDPGVRALAQAITARREQIRIKPAVAAGLAGIEPVELRRIEEARQELTTGTLAAIAQALRTTPDQLQYRAALLAADYETEVPA
jgi:hypothetical protein